jgi:hypothetical protein
MTKHIMDEIEYQNRYSQTDEPDKQGRWAITATYKNIRIAWISKHFCEDKYTFCASCHFPTMQNDIANETKVFFSLGDAKDFVYERWNFFLTAVS